MYVHMSMHKTNVSIGVCVCGWVSVCVCVGV